MKNGIVKFFAIFIAFCFSLFLGINNVEAKAGDSIDKAGAAIDKEDNNKLVSYFIPFGYSEDYYDLCYYRFDRKKINEFITVTGFAYIGYNPVADEFYFRWVTFGMSGGGAAETYYHINTDTDFYVSRSSLTSNNGESEDGDETQPLIRFKDGSLSKLKKGVCPQWVDYTGEGFKDDNGDKRICFSDEEATCNSVGPAWNNRGKNYAFELSSNYSGGEGAIYKIGSIIMKYADKVSQIEIDDSFCDMNEDTAGAKILEIRDDMNAAASKKVMQSYKKYKGNLNILSYDNKKIIPGSSVYNRKSNANNNQGYVSLFVSAYENKVEEIAKYCEQKGLASYDEIYEHVTETVELQIEADSLQLSPDENSAIVNCKSITDTKTYEMLQYIFTGIKIAVPILLLVLISKDIISAVTAGKEEDMKKAKKNAVIRLIVGVVIMLLPTIVNIIVMFVDDINGGSCGIE